MEHRLVGKIVEWDGERWLVDSSDELVKEEYEETSLFLVPEECINLPSHEYKRINIDKIGYWVLESDVTEIEGT